jgi:CHAT domain-containing protein
LSSLLGPFASPRPPPQLCELPLLLLAQQVLQPHEEPDLGPLDLALQGELNSGLALSIPEHPAEGQENGILQAWEIFESLRLDADLVTLSACDTALGRDMGGEGILGLTRAFQFAGARSVLASLWSVADDSTAELMRRFYTYLKQGKSKDEALRLAQVDLIHGPEATSHPYHWAAFQLSGDWR